MRKLLIISIIAFVLFSASVSHTQAQDFYTCTFDFTMSESGWAIRDDIPGDIPEAIYGAGYEDTLLMYWSSEFPNRWSRRVYVQLLLSTEVTFTSYGMVLSAYDRGGAYITAYAGINMFEDGNFSTRPINGSPSTATTNNGGTFSSGAISRNGSLLTIWINTNARDGADPGGNIVLSSATFTALNSTPPPPEIASYCDYEAEQLTRPIRDSDLGPQGITNNENTSGVFAFSDEVGDMVFSVSSGTVETIRRAYISDCDKFEPGLDFPIPGSYAFCPIVVSMEEGGFVLSSSFSLEPYDIANAFAGELGGRLRGYYVKIVGDDEKEYEYILDNPQIYIEEGMEIEAGCGIGETLRLYRSEINLGIGISGDVAAGLSFTYSQQGVAILVFDDSIDPEEQIIPDAGIPAVGNDACNKQPGFEGCYGDTNFSFNSQWSASGSVDFKSPGLSMGGGSSITSTPYNLNADNMPIFRINAKSFGTSEVTLTLGTASQTITINSSSFADYSLEPPSPAPDDGSFYTIRIDNSGSTLEIQYICVSDTLEDGDDDPETPPTPKPPPQPDRQGCLFQNPSFTEREANWTLSLYQSIRDGEIIFQDGGEWRQLISLYPAEGGDQTYTVTVRASLAIYAGYVADETDNTGNVTIEWDFPYPNSYQTIGSVTRGQFDLSYNLVTFQDTFDISSDTSGDFSFRVDYASMPTGVYGVAIRDVCIEAGDTTDGSDPDEFPGDWDDTVPGDDPIFDAQCDLISKPTGNNLGQWINYLWLELNSFFQCDLMVLLNSWFEAFNEAMNTIMWFLRWMMIVFSDGIDWLATDLLYWLNGHLSNIAQGQVTFIQVEEGTKQCNNLFCALTGFFGSSADIISDIADTISIALTDVLAPIVEAIVEAVLTIIEFVLGAAGAILDLVIFIITTFINLVISFIERVISLLDYIDDLFLWFTGQLNTTPVEVPMLPYCATNPEANIGCRLFWTLDNTVFTGPGEAIPLLITSWAVVMLILWAVATIKKSIMDSGQVI